MAVDFMYIGASRAGSTYLAEVLRNHPDIILPLGKPVRYWNRYIDGGIGIGKPVYKVWAKDQYKKAMDRAPGKLKGDITDGYTQIPFDRIQRIHIEYPNVKILYCIRNPLDVILSHYGLKGKVEGETITKELIEHKLYTEDSYWANNIDFAGNIRRWREVFGKNLFVYKFEDLVSQPINQFKQICNHIGADPKKVDYIQPDILNRKKNGRKVDYEFTSRAKEWLNDYCRHNMIEAEKLTNLDLSDYYT